MSVITENEPTSADLAEIDLTEYVSIQNAPVSTESFDFVTNGSYRNKSGALSDYFRKRCFVLVWNNKEALVRFATGGPIYTVSRNHLTID